MKTRVSLKILCMNENSILGNGCNELSLLDLLQQVSLNQAFLFPGHQPFA